MTLRNGGAAFRAALAESKAFLAERRKALLAELATLPPAGANASVDAKRSELEQAASALQARISNANAPEPLTDREPSLFVSIGGGILKITEIGPGEAKATTLVTPKPARSSRNGRFLPCACRKLTAA